MLTHTQFFFRPNRRGYDARAIYMSLTTHLLEIYARATPQSIRPKTHSPNPRSLDALAENRLWRSPRANKKQWICLWNVNGEGVVATTVFGKKPRVAKRPAYKNEGLERKSMGVWNASENIFHLRSKGVEEFSG